MSHSNRGRMTEIQSRAQALRPVLVQRHHVDPRALIVSRFAFALFVVVYLVIHLGQGWVPHDEGAVAQSAQRVLAGELPHRDFAELYTGGLTFLNAGVLKLVGPNIAWLRVPLLVCFLIYLWVVYLLASRFANRALSMLVVLFAVSWGLPTYPGALSSWYLLTFSVSGMYCLVRFMETRHGSWLLGTGLLGGLSICIKITGVWFLGAVLLFMVFLWSIEDSRSAVEVRSRGRALLAVAVPIVIFGLALAVIGSHFGNAEVVNLILPVLAICVVSVYAIVLGRGDRQAASGPGLGTQVGYLSLGVAIPVGLLLIPFLVTGSISDLITGVFVTPRTRWASASGAYMSPQSAEYVVLAASMLGLASACYVARRRIGRAADVAFAGLGIAVVAYSGTLTGYQAVWHTVRALVPCIVVLGAIALAWRLHSSRTERATLATPYLMLAMTAFLALNQFPFGAPIYFCFVAPVAVLAAIASLRMVGIRDAVLPGIALLALVVFGFARLDGGDVYSLGWTPVTRPQNMVLDEERASIRVSGSEREMYRRVATLLEERSSGRFTFAGPDAPELYVLSGLRNPTRSLFDVLDPMDSSRGTRLIEALAAQGVTAIAVNLQPTYSPPLEDATMAKLRSLFPSALRVDRFEVRWRSASSPDRARASR